MIKRVVLDNWKTHKHSEFEFGKGTNVLVGIMGSGKTSVLNAISFALYGTYPALRAKRQTLGDVVTNKPYLADSAKVIVDFEVNGNTYQVMREIDGKGKTSLSEIRHDGKLVEGPSPQKVTEAISLMLGMDYDLFSRAVYSEQNQIDYFLTIPKGKRKAQIDDLLRLDKYESARKGATFIVNRLNDKTKELEERLGDAQKKLSETDFKSLEKEISELKEKIIAFEKKNAEMKRKLEENEEDYKKESEKKKEYDKRNEMRLSLNAKIELIKKEVKEFEDETGQIEQNINEITRKDLELGKEIQNLERKVHDFSNELSKKKSELAVFDNEVARIKSIEKERSEFASEFEELKKNNPKINDDIELLKKSISEDEAKTIYSKNKLKEIRENSEKLQNADSKCPVCKGDLSTHSKEQIINEYREERDRISKEMELLDAKMKKDSENILKLEKIRSRISELESRIRGFGKISDVNALNEKISLLKTEVERKTEELKEAEVYLKVKTEEKQQLKRIIDVAKKKSNVTTLEKELKENKGLIKLLGFEPEKYENLRNEVNTISNEIKMGISSMENTKQIVKEKETRLNEIKQKEKEITEMKGIIEKVKISSNDFTLFKNSLLATQTKLREQFIEESNELMDELWANIYPYEDYIGAKLAVDSGDYTLQLKEKSGKWVDVDAVASGGERSAAALVLRLAFAFRLAENLSWIILDEPTHNLDETAVLKLAALMHNNLPNMLNQTFVITHDNNMRMAATEYIYDIKRNKNMEGWATPEKIEI